MNIAPGEIGAAAAPLNRARSMPAGFYTDPEIFHRERERIFLKQWFFLCREDQLPNVGDLSQLRHARRAHRAGAQP
jgi:phenylpropionate dioxygenase-like ring-hydroxylating dioxygenase large terminal subunit